MPRKYGTYKKGKKTMFRKKPRTVDAKQNTSIRILKKKVKALEAPIELKYLYGTLNSSTISGVSSIQQTLNLIRPWDSSTATANNSKLNAREGDKVSMKKLMIRGKLMLPYNTLSVTRQATTRVRMIYVYYAEEPPSNNINDILETGLTGTDIVDYFYKRNSKLKYKVLKDVTLNLQPDYYNYSDPATPTSESYSGVQSTKPSFHTIRHNINLSRLPNMGQACWDDATSLPKMGQIAVYIFSDNPFTDVNLTSVTQLTWLDQ
jgi:hypothetical protein